MIDAGNLQGADFQCLAEVGGYPVVAYTDTQFGVRTNVRRGLTTTGSSWGPELTVANPDDSVYYWIELIDLHGLPAVAVYNTSRSQGMFSTPGLYD